MKRGRSTGTPTMAQQLRFAAIQEVGCLICSELLGSYFPTEIHHLTIGGKHGQKRRGHDFTIGLCAFHHRGYPVYWSAYHDLGPSYAFSPRAFRQTFGDDESLLARQNELIAGQSRAVATADALMGALGYRRVLG